MDGLSLAASVVAVIQIIGSCLKLSKKWIGPSEFCSSDLTALTTTLYNLNGVLKNFQTHLEIHEEDEARLNSLEFLKPVLVCCEESLDVIKAFMKNNGFMGKHLVGPKFDRKLKASLKALDRAKGLFMQALHADQHAILLAVEQYTRNVAEDLRDVGNELTEGIKRLRSDVDKVYHEVKKVRTEQQRWQDAAGETTSYINQKIDLAKLPSAEGAAFDSHREENEARCLQGTRTDLLRQIKEWAHDAQGKRIFWLNGMAGTGKSTVSRTVAQSFADEGQLAASFFFKRGEGDRGTAAKFFTTIAAQLVTKVPPVVPYVRKAIEADPAIAEKAMKRQFEKLILEPLCEVELVSPLVVVIDALDECECEDHINVILHLLSQTNKPKGSVRRLRMFVTSRPELPIRFGFNNMLGGIYQDLVLQDIPQSIIEHDISAFLLHEFAEIKKQHDSVRREHRWLRSDWPGERNIRTLVQMATPLFIFAATVCRFVGDLTADPETRLATVLSYQKQKWESIDKTYIPILNQLLVNGELTDSEKENIAKEFRNIVGPIIILAEPLSTAALASLLNIPKNVIDYRLDSLHSVLSVHQDSPVRPLHLSFRDFLLDIEKRGKNTFWVDERETNELVMIKCLERISSTTSLRKNICNQENPGKLRIEIDRQIINKCLPADIQYACRYWVYHLEQSKSRVCDHDRVHLFLQERFLYWLEALSLMGKISESITQISTLQSLVTGDEGTHVARFLEDAKRFVLKNRWIVDTAPLQLYASAIAFAPERSIVKDTFKGLVPSWIPRLSNVESAWGATLQILEGHEGWVSAVAFSRDGRLLASASHDNTVRL